MVGKVHKISLRPQGFHLAVLMCFAVTFIGGLPAMVGQKPAKAVKPRKIVTQVAPIYPPDLKRASIGGTVRLDIVVSAKGHVDYVQVAGGNPILVEAATQAVKQWKYAPAATSTNIRVNLRFDPSQ